jgi:two-component system chemotaxis response regulator CheY
MFPMEAQLMALNILLVDDSNVVKAVLFRILTQSSLPINQIYDAANGAEALEVLESHRMDLVVADINMPVMDGVEMIEWMRADTRFKHIPVVVISTEGSSSRIDKLRNLGIEAYIRKPFSSDEIQTIFSEIFGES